MNMHRARQLPSRRNACQQETVLGILAAVRTYLQGIFSLHAQLLGSGLSFTLGRGADEPSRRRR